MNLIEMAYASECFEQEERERKKRKIIADLRANLPQTGAETWSYFVSNGLANATQDEIAQIERAVNDLNEYRV